MEQNLGRIEATTTARSDLPNELDHPDFLGDEPHKNDISKIHCSITNLRKPTTPKATWPESKGADEKQNEPATISEKSATPEDLFGDNQDSTGSSSSNQTPNTNKSRPTRKAKEIAKRMIAPTVTAAKHAATPKHKQCKPCHPIQEPTVAGGSGPAPDKEAEEITQDETLTAYLATPEMEDHHRGAFTLIRGNTKTGGFYKLHYITPNYTTVGCSKVAHTARYTPIETAEDY